MIKVPYSLFLQINFILVSHLLFFSMLLIMNLDFSKDLTTSSQIISYVSLDVSLIASYDLPNFINLYDVILLELLFFYLQLTSFQYLI
jgi:hypothetical protein